MTAHLLRIVALTMLTPARLPRPARVPCFELETARAQAACAPGFRAERITSNGSTLRLVDGDSKRAA